MPFPSSWCEAVLETQRAINFSIEPRTYDPSDFPIERGLKGRYAITSGGEHIGDITLEMNLHCYADTAVSELSPTDATLYDALQESENIGKCCDRVMNKNWKKDGLPKRIEYMGWTPDDDQGEGMKYDMYYSNSPGSQNANYSSRVEVGLYSNMAAGGLRGAPTSGGTILAGVEGSLTRGQYIPQEAGPKSEKGYCVRTCQLGEEQQGLEGYIDLHPKAKHMNYTKKFNF